MISDRIKMVRMKSGLSQAAFGERLGVSRDVVNNVENDRLKKPEQKESLYRLICREFSVKETWLRTGEGEMLLPEPKDVTAEVAERLKLNDFEALILRAYMDLPQELRNNFCAGMYDNLFKAKKNPALEKPETGKQAETSWERDARLLNEEADAVKKVGEALSASQHTKNA